MHYICNVQSSNTKNETICYMKIKNQVRHGKVSVCQGENTLRVLNAFHSLACMLPDDPFPPSVSESPC